MGFGIRKWLTDSNFVCEDWFCGSAARLSGARKFAIILIKVSFAFCSNKQQHCQTRRSATGHDVEIYVKIINSFRSGPPPDQLRRARTNKCVRACSTHMWNLHLSCCWRLRRWKARTHTTSRVCLIFKTVRIIGRLEPSFNRGTSDDARDAGGLESVEWNNDFHGEEWRRED